MNKNKDFHVVIDKVIDSMFEVKTIYETCYEKGSKYMDLREWPQGVALWHISSVKKYRKWRRCNA